MPCPSPVVWPETASPFLVDQDGEARRLIAEAARGPALVGSIRFDAARRPLQDVVTCVRLGLTLGTAGTAIRGNAEHELRSPAAMQALYHDDPEALARTLEVAERCNFSLAQLRYRYPAESVPEGSSEPEWLRQLTLEGARWRYDGAVPLPVRANAENIKYLMTKRDRMGHELTGLDEYHESNTMESYDEAAYLLGERHRPGVSEE